MDGISLEQRPISRFKLLYLFAGQPRKADLADFLDRTDIEVVAVDILLDESRDVADSEYWDALRARVRQGVFDLVLVSPPCNTFSRAVFSNSKGPRPLRNADFSCVFPWLSGSDKQKADLGSLLLKRALSLAELCSKEHVPWLLEHPEFLGACPKGVPASVWMLEEFQSLVQKFSTSTAVFHQCTFGADFPKPTRVAGTWSGMRDLGYNGWPMLDKHLRYRGPLPRSCGHNHQALIGQDEDGAFLTKPTAAYPPGLCAALAQMAQQTVRGSIAKGGGSSSIVEPCTGPSPTADRSPGNGPPREAAREVQAMVVDSSGEETQNLQQEKVQNHAQPPHDEGGSTSEEDIDGFWKHSNPILGIGPPMKTDRRW